MDFQYDVFLSYRHRPLDSLITEKTFHMLESYKLPDSFAQKGLHGVRRAFRDTEELAVTRILSDNIRQALHSTDCLVVVCSPDTPSSEWVDREVETFIELGRSHRIFPLLIAGTPEDSFPPALKRVPDVMHRLMDVCAVNDRPKAILQQEELALLRVIAAVSGCEHEDLLRQHKLRQLRRNTARHIAAAALFSGVFLSSLGLWIAARSYQVQAKREQTASMAMLEQLTYDLPDNLAELPGTYPTVAAMLEENAGQIIRILRLAGEDAAVMEQIAANYEKVATASLRLGRYEQAAQRQVEALGIYEQLAAQRNAQTLKPLASAHNNLGVIQNRAGSFAQAADAYQQAILLQEQLLTFDSSYENRCTLLTFENNRSVNAMNGGDYDSAILPLTETLEQLTLLSEGENRNLDADIARTSLNLGVCLSQNGRYPEAQSAFEAAVLRAQSRYDALPNRTNLSLLAQSLAGLAACHMYQADFAAAFPVFDRAVTAQQLLAADLDNIEQQTALAALVNNYGLCLNMSGDFAAAAEWYLLNVELNSRLHQQLGTPLSQATLARACYNVAENAFKLGNAATVRSYFDRCLALYEPVSRNLGSYHESEYLARLAYYQIIVAQDFPAALASAAEAISLQPQSVFAHYNFGYALLYNSEIATAQQVFVALAGISDGEVETVRLDFVALTQAGLAHPDMEAILTMMTELRHLP